MIDFDLNGRKLALDALSEQKPVTLRRAESRALERLLEPPT
jgi:hypothetical protein